MNSLLALSTPPQSLTDLHIERTYLLNSLQVQNRTANDILCKLPPLEEKRQSHHDFPSTVRRRVRKQINWFKHRLNEVNRQDQAVSARLVQIEGEIQARERIAQFEHEKWCAWLDYVHGSQIQHHDPISPEYWYTGYEWNLFELPISPGFVGLSQQQLYQQSYSEVPLQDATPPGYFPPSATTATVTSRSLKLSPLSPSFEPSGIFTPDSPYLQLPWQRCPEPASTWHPPQQQYHHHDQQDDTRYLSLSSEFQHPYSPTEVSPTQTNHDERNENTIGGTSKLASLSKLTNLETDIDPTTALKIVSLSLNCDVHDPHTPHLRLTTPKPGTKRRPVSMDHESLCAARKDSVDENGVATSTNAKVKRNSLPNLGGDAEDRRKSLPV